MNVTWLKIHLGFHQINTGGKRIFFLKNALKKEISTGSGIIAVNVRNSSPCERERNGGINVQRRTQLILVHENWKNCKWNFISSNLSFYIN